MVPGTLIVVSSLKPGAWTGLWPDTLYIILEKEDSPRPSSDITLTAEEFDQLRRVSLVCADVPGENASGLRNQLPFTR
ncbi:MAG: hypothetical protein N3G18_01750 [Candidatus Saccharicenans sp.]|nr:hypothetical protein [Candidatus Saccharicenans sp.]